MKKKALLVVGLALLMATAGVVYAHWTDTLTVSATINTGNVLLGWTDVFTNDDGAGADETGLPGAIYTYSIDGITSVDPSGRPIAGVALRYTKDVADCHATINPADAHGFGIVVSNAYPSYYCTITSTYTNLGTVPVKLQSIAATTNVTLFGQPGAHGEKFTEDGTLCGVQIDPGETETTINTLHLLNPALQNAQYTFSEIHSFVNWNEWNSGLCSLTLNGNVMPWGIEPQL